ncbi:MAG TPA: hypothetical protein PLD46_05390 [Hyphomicrobium sp.]|nr:hypothetical protein [Hyphomicrobium sp.]
MIKMLTIAVFIAILAAGLMYGVARDLYSSERAVLSGTVASVTAATSGHKTTPVTASSLEVALADGRTIHVAAPDVGGLSNGQGVQISEMTTPWGQVWYKLKHN